jgi:hypothetical protein
MNWGNPQQKRENIRKKAGKLSHSSGPIPALFTAWT